MTDHNRINETALLDQLGGPSGLVYTAVPVAAFVAANAFLGLPVAIGIAIAAALVARQELPHWHHQRFSG
ncbi:hypothetical protein GCM10010191_11440 [Actinomadura vinacea]|uniref:Uncharacterized protein n=1 Tax=Actinomadura vinacea TaxID=115336 RepID=A0ABP5VJV5_9ACTN